MANAPLCDADCSCPICWPPSRTEKMLEEQFGTPLAKEAIVYPVQKKDNKPLYDALMDKANSYHPERETYQADAYARAAYKVADLEDSVFRLPDAQQRLLGVGPKTNQFIYRWIRDSHKTTEEAPQKMVDLTCHLEQEFLSLQHHIQDLVGLTKDKPVYRQVLESLDVQVGQLYNMEKAQQLLATLRK